MVQVPLLRSRVKATTEGFFSAKALHFSTDLNFLDVFTAWILPLIAKPSSTGIQSDVALAKLTAGTSATSIRLCLIIFFMDSPRFTFKFRVRFGLGL